MITFSALCKDEPHLLILESRCRNFIPVENQSLNSFWYYEIKPTLLQLVGWNAQNPKLKGEQEYDVAYFHLYDCLS